MIGSKTGQLCGNPCAFSSILRGRACLALRAADDALPLRVDEATGVHRTGRLYSCHALLRHYTGAKRGRPHRRLHSKRPRAAIPGRAGRDYSRRRPFGRRHGSDCKPRGQPRPGCADERRSRRPALQERCPRSWYPAKYRRARCNDRRGLRRASAGLRILRHATRRAGR